MKTTKITALLMAAVMMMGGTACEHNKKGVPPADAKVDFSAPAPVPVPEEGWTDETLGDVIYLNGKKLQLPCYVEDLGEGFEVEPDEEREKNLEDKGYSTFFLDYYGYNVGVISLKGADRKVISLDLTCYDDYDKLVKEYPKLPFSVNGVTIGSSIEDMRTNLGKDSADDKEPDYFSCCPDKLWVTAAVLEDKVKTISVTYRKNGTQDTSEAEQHEVVSNESN
ncbi:hypothetical protein [Ruminococcus sp.]|uniref:hypothetical protein n=1 Tax=Ruminococcus sp. TaxID=41978 RepID=UPI0025E3DDA5|nr:hypothetical protein [Ruminococcus sp.]MBQ8966595.1 hypothetical protein [Ruminococcus sp.]